MRAGDLVIAATVLAVGRPVPAPEADPGTRAIPLAVRVERAWCGDLGELGDPSARRLSVQAVVSPGAPVPRFVAGRRYLIVRPTIFEGTIPARVVPLTPALARLLRGLPCVRPGDVRRSELGSGP